MADILLSQFGPTGNGNSTPVGDVQLDFKPGEIKHRESTRHTSDVNFPSGAYRIRVVPSFAGEPVLVNGTEYDAGEVFEVIARTNLAGELQDFAPEVVVVSNGNEYAFLAEYPSTHAVDLSNL
ncbi:MAG: hypothetical protein AAFW73_26350 [Bacteroidota bacterium]